jgi:hypothetical protein
VYETFSAAAESKAVVVLGVSAEACAVQRQQATAHIRAFKDHFILCSPIRG